MPDLMNIFGDTSKVKDNTNDWANQLISDTTEDKEVSLSPMYDFVFRVWMNDKLVLEEFLDAVLGRKVEVLNIQTQVDIKEALPKYRGIRLDIKAIGKNCNMESVEIYDIESQRQHYSDNRERCVFYASRLISLQLKEGDKFSKLKPTTIIFVNLESLQKDRFLQSASLRFNDKPEEVYYDKLQIVELNLDKLQEFQNELYKNGHLSKNTREDKLDFFASFCLIGDKEEAFKNFYEKRKFEFDNLLENLLNTFRLIRNDKQIKEQVKEYVREYGEVKEVTTMRLSDSILEEGRKEGRKEEKKDTILNLYHLGVDVTTISKGVRLTEQEVLDIINKHKT